MTTGINSFHIHAGFRELYLSKHNANLELTRAYAVQWSLPLHTHFCPHWGVPHCRGRERVQVLEEAGRLKLQPQICYLLTEALGNLLRPAKPCFSPLQSVCAKGCCGNSRMQSVAMLHSGADFPSIPLLLEKNSGESGISQEDRLPLTSLPGSLLCYSLGSDYLSIWI